jgi:hypothetical protein
VDPVRRSVRAGSATDRPPADPGGHERSRRVRRKRRPLALDAQDLTHRSRPEAGSNPTSRTLIPDGPKTSKRPCALGSGDDRLFRARGTILSPSEEGSEWTSPSWSTARIRKT